VVGGLALLGIFVPHERRTPASALALTLFRRRNFTLVTLALSERMGRLADRYGPRPFMASDR
jgi:hypothetical protein